MADAKKSSKFLEFALLFAIVYLVSDFGMRFFFPEWFGDKKSDTPIVLEAPNVKGGHHPLLTVKNNTDAPLEIPSRCPLPPVDVFKVNADKGSLITPVTSDQNAIPCEPVASIPPGKTGQINLAPWKYSIFGEYGMYEVRLNLNQQPATSNQLTNPPTSATGSAILTKRFDHYEPGVFTKVFRTFITKPFLNFLIFTASLLPDYSLGISIIILTILVKLLLFYPTQKAMEGQREMQKMQPKLEAIKEKHKGNPELIQQETLKLWKEHKINPLSSCLPTLIQFPILIGLFYTIRDGSVLALSKHLIYPMYQNLDWTFGTQFLGLDLLKPDPFVVPALLVILQFIQMKLAFHMAKKKKEAKEGKEGKQGVEGKSSPQDIQQKIMMYGLPLMIGFFALKFPAAVSIYWGVSTLFGIGQQIVVNRKSA